MVTFKSHIHRPLKWPCEENKHQNKENLLKRCMNCFKDSQQNLEPFNTAINGLSHPVKS